MDGRISAVRDRAEAARPRWWRRGGSGFDGMAAALAGLSLWLAGCSDEMPREYVGSASCRDCHETFYELWSTSHHGTALQPWSEQLAAALPPQPEPIEADGRLYHATITPERGWVTEDGKVEFEIVYAIGGKNYYNLLTLLDDGRLQVLPVFYDVREGEWGNTTLSMLRHFSDGREDAALHWRDSMLTFNAACFSCHVSQIESNYDPATDTYATVWNEPGISCESCHGPSSEHVRVCRAAPPDRPPKDLKIIGWNELEIDRQVDACAGCHTKGAPITQRFETGDRYWDHYDLTTFEHLDYHPDGRDFGENYTMGSWWLSPCVKPGGLSCTHCHTSSGRYKFKDEQANHACLPCHQERVENAAAHMNHPKGGATECVHCHMPMTPFGGMNQSDHSMRPPLPNLSMAVGSRNACVMCHKDKDHEWALAAIRSWHPDFDERSQPELDRALLVKALRDGDWSKLPAALEFIAAPTSEPLFVATLIRLLPAARDPRQHELLRPLATGAAHPLVRAAAAVALDGDDLPADRPALIAALADEFRLVRIRAAERLAALRPAEIPPEHRAAFNAATAEMWASLNLRLDHWASHFNAGNILMRQGRHAEAAAKYDRAHELRNDIAPPLINGAMAHASLGALDQAESRLKKATSLPEPSPEAHFNLGLLHAEQNRPTAAEAALRKCLELDPRNAAAACNLAILRAAKKDYPETFRLLELAITAEPANPRHVHTLAFYYLEAGRQDLARTTIERALARGVRSPEIEDMLRRLR